MNIKERDGLFNFELTTDEERNMFLNALFGFGFTINGKREFIYEVIFKSLTLPDSMIETILSNNTLSAILAKNSHISSDIINKLLAKNDNEINFNLLRNIEDEKLFNEVLSKLIENKYNKFYTDRPPYLLYKLTNLDNFKKLYDIIYYNDNLDDFVKSDVYRQTSYLFTFLNNKYDYLDEDRLSYIYTLIKEKVLKDIDPKFLTKRKFKDSDRAMDAVHHIFEEIMRNERCPDYILKELSKCCFSTYYREDTLGSIARGIIDKRKRESIV